MSRHLFPYEWKLSDGYPAKGINHHGAKVFSCFAGGGGSSMGYKLAGYDIIGCNEIDEKMIDAYRINHKPKYSYLEPIQDFKLRTDLPDELFSLDILDGSPPCSSFSTAGKRDKDWGKKKKFREGQVEQVLDTLFFDFIELAKTLQPKIIIAENVKGMLASGAIEYVGKIMECLDDAGYIAGYKLLNASTMGVPQMRERVFFYAIKERYAGAVGTTDMFGSTPKLELRFNETPILFKEIHDGSDLTKNLTPLYTELWEGTRVGHSFKEAHPTGACFNEQKNHPDRPSFTIRASGALYHHSVPRKLNDVELARAGTFPSDYKTVNTSMNYLVGMSVPPVMMAQIAHQVKCQWLCDEGEINDGEEVKSKTRSAKRKKKGRSK